MRLGGLSSLSICSSLLASFSFSKVELLDSSVYLLLFLMSLETANQLRPALMIDRRVVMFFKFPILELLVVYIWFGS